MFFINGFPDIDAIYMTLNLRYMTQKMYVLM